MTSPLDLPEILELVVSHLETEDLARACQVSVLFHNVCTPFLWRAVSLVGNRANRVWNKDEGFRQGLIQYGPLVHTLRLGISEVQDEDMEFIAANCTRLKSLDLSYADVTVETLKILLHSDPYKTSPASSDKPYDNVSVDVNALMEQYRSMTDTEDRDYHLSESVGLPASSIESEPHQDQPTGPVLTSGSRHTSNGVRPVTFRRNTGGQDGAARPAKFKDAKARFPFHLEELNLARCGPLYGPKLLPILALLGPQLRSLYVDDIADVAGVEHIEDSSRLIQLLKHCPNLTRLGLECTDVGQGFVAALTGVTKELAPRAMEGLNLHMTQVNSDSLVPLIKASRDKMRQITFPSNRDIEDSAIYAFIEDARKVNKTLHPIRSFVRNDILSVLQLNKSVNITHEALLDLFRHTTALRAVELNGVDVRDDALEALAAANRNRMERLGLGIPEAWIQHEQGAVKLMDKQSSASVVPAGRKLYDGTWVPNGLQALSLKNCSHVTNQGVRAIVRSCPILAGLNLSGCERVSMRVFRGPWVCSRMQHLDISGIDMRIQDRTASILMEEQLENERFPLTPLLKTHPSDDFRDDGHYDFMIPPMEMDGENELHDSDIVDEDGPVQEDEENPMNPRENMYPAKAYRNDGETRRTLNEFYRKLGQFDQLKNLNMAKSDYRIRIQDGLDLVLPALTKNLEQWNMGRPFDYILQNAELKWFGKHFGYGFDFSRNGDELERQRKIRDEYRKSYDDDDDGDDDEEDEEYKPYGMQDELSDKDPNRVSKLKVLLVCTDSIELGNLDGDVYEWFKKSGFDVHLLNDRAMMSDDESESGDEWDSDEEFDSEDELDGMNDELDGTNDELDDLDE
ncbi:hypothetical protein BGZ99_009366 [Dissophora globulifera]|uniref:F-box domain-containing protein n=1 Tax=Dissophora globulifera TaxID=979702 RepID=A0A9P6UNM2_9FUNG|nr:hypothetical protein BGZ99_009366 [Dissophora globulifera]